MKRTAWLIGSVFFIVSSYAQVERKVTDLNSINGLSKNEAKSSRELVNNNTDKLKVLKELNLTREQKVKLKEMRLANQSKRDVITNDPVLTKAQKQDQLNGVKRSAAKDLKNLLTVEQIEKMKAMRSEKEDRNIQAVQ